MLNENMELSLGLLCYIKFLFNEIRMKCNGFRPFYTLSCYPMVNQTSKILLQNLIHTKILILALLMKCSYQACRVTKNYDNLRLS